MAARLALEHLADRGDHGRVLHRLADRGSSPRARAVDVAPRVVMEQVADRLDAHPLEDLMCLQRLLRPGTRATFGQPGIDVDDRGIERELHGAFLIGDRFYHASGWRSAAREPSCRRSSSSRCSRPATCDGSSEPPDAGRGRTRRAERHHRTACCPTHVAELPTFDVQTLSGAADTDCAGRRSW